MSDNYDDDDELAAERAKFEAQQNRSSRYDEQGIEQYTLDNPEDTSSSDNTSTQPEPISQEDRKEELLDEALDILNQADSKKPSKIIESDKTLSRQISVEDMDIQTISSVADSLLNNDVGLLSLALSSAPIEHAKAIINDIREVTFIDLTDIHIRAGISHGQIDVLQKYETNHRSYLVNLIRKSLYEEAINNQKTNTKVRYSGFRMWFAVGISVFTGAYIFFITYKNIDFANTVLGFLMGTLVGTVVNFYFGASAKQSDLANISEKSSSGTEEGNIDESELK